MRSVLLALLAITVFFACDNTEKTLSSDQVPAAVQQAFATTSPDTDVEWEAEEDGSFEAEYTLNGAAVSATYSATGELLETEVEIEKAELPAAVQNAIATQFSGYEIEEAARIDYPDGRVAYEAELHGDDDQTFDAIFAPDGRLVERAPPEKDIED